ncbi:MAG: chorismate synthase [Candidatus Sericytochromatia bacterium]|nr:MAG: chorismate synthase [Candidatus Sericytochromatia bacterium]
MSGNSFGKIFRITTFGESHGNSIGVVIDGCPSNLDIDLDFIKKELNRRKPGQSEITTSRKEDDEIEILSGIFNGKTIGTPISIIVKNKDFREKDYYHIYDKFRPSHADYTYYSKYGIRDYRGGGRASARETIARVIAGAIAKIILRKYNISVIAYVSQIGDIALEKNYKELDLNNIESNIVRCPDNETATKMIELIKNIKKEGDSIGGIITCVVFNVPVGLGEPVFDKLNADLAKAIFSINAVKGFEIGSGFNSVYMKGSEHNDIFYNDNNIIKTKTNYSGGIQGGISNGEDIYFRVAFKPVATILKEQNSIDIKGNEVIIEGKGRHDPCVLPRAVPIVEAMTALVIVDHILRNKSSKI